MRKKKGNLLQRTVALLLSVVLAAGMALDAVPLTVMAQENAGGGYNAAEESVSGNTVTEEATEQESEKKDNVPESGEDTQESDGEETAADSEAETTGDTEESEETEKPVENPAAAEEDGVSEQAGDDIASGTDWTIDKDGKLTIASDTGMTNWEGDENHYGNKKIIETVELLDGVTFIKESAFFESSLTAITIPSSVTKIETGAFWGCQSLTNITIPESVTSMGWAVFEHCESLESVTVLRENPAEIGENVFTYCKFVTGNEKGIKVPEGTAAEYKAAWTEWPEYITDGTDARRTISLLPVQAGRLPNLES